MKIWNGLEVVDDPNWRDKILGNHREIDPDDWWMHVMVWVLGPEPWRRIKVGTEGTVLRAIGSVRNYCLKRLAKDKKLKLYLSYATFKPGTGQSEADVAYPIKRVLDFDTDTVATEKQFLQLSEMFPCCYMVWANGIQVFLEPSHLPADTEAYMLAALGEEAAKRTGLHYDGHSLTKAGLPAKYQSHAYRAPWGWASRAERPIKCFEPLVGGNGQPGEWNVQDAVEASGVKWSVPSPTDLPLFASGPAAVSGPGPHTTGKGKISKKRSQGEKYEEFIAILRHRRQLLIAGKTLAQAEAEALAYPWRYHTAKDIKRIYSDPKYVAYHIHKGGGTTAGGATNYQGALSDQQALIFQLGPKTEKRTWLQTGWQVFKQRAWSFEWLYQFQKEFGMTEELAVMAFMQWPEFKEIRELSLRYLGPIKLERDLRRLWTKFANREVVAPKILEAIYKKAAKLKVFTRAKIAPLVPEAQSRRHLQRALRELARVGALRMTGRNKGAKWEVTAIPLPPVPATKPIVPTKKKISRPKAPTPKVSPPPTEIEGTAKVSAELPPKEEAPATVAVNPEPPKQTLDEKIKELNVRLANYKPPRITQKMIDKRQEEIDKTMEEYGCSAAEAKKMFLPLRLPRKQRAEIEAAIKAAREAEKAKKASKKRNKGTSQSGDEKKPT